MDINKYNPKGKINNKHLLTLQSYSTEEIFEILHLSRELKKMHYAKAVQAYLKNKTVALIFAKSSTRTRVSFEQGVRQMQGQPLFLSSNDIQLGRGETISDTVKTLERYGIDAIMIRTFAQSDVEDLAKYGTIPIINGLTDKFHPCQALADIMTVWEKKGRLNGIKLCYLGDGNNMANSLITVCTKVEMPISLACPKGFEPDNTVVQRARQFGDVIVTDDPYEAAKDADVIYTDVFFSMGQQIDGEKRKKLMKFQVNAKLMKHAKPDAVFMHCLPAHRGEEVTEEIIDGKQSVIFDEAENRLHVQKAVMALLIK